MTSLWQTLCINSVLHKTEMQNPGGGASAPPCTCLRAPLVFTDLHLDRPIYIYISGLDRPEPYEVFQHASRALESHCCKLIFCQLAIFLPLKIFVTHPVRMAIFTNPFLFFSIMT